MENIIAVFIGEKSLMLSHIAAWTNVSFSAGGDKVSSFVCGRACGAENKMIKSSPKKIIYGLCLTIIRLPLKTRSERFCCSHVTLFKCCGKIFAGCESRFSLDWLMADNTGRGPDLYPGLGLYYDFNVIPEGWAS